MTLAERLSEYVRACFTGLWVQTHEPDDALAEIARLCHAQHWALSAWDVDRGLSLAAQPTDAAAAMPAADPLAAIRALNAPATPDGAALLVLRNFHRFLGSVEVVQALDSQLVAGKQDRTFVVVLAPLVQIPVELEKLFLVIEHELPGRDQLDAIARSIACEPGEWPDGDERTAVLDAAAGLTRMEAEGAFSLSLVRHGRIAAGPIWELKTQTLKKSGLLTLHRGGETFADLGGLDALKTFCARALRPGRRAGVRARGVLLLGVPGTGKSQFCKALGSETGRPTIILDVGALKGGLVGLTEERTRRALAQIDQMAPCVVLVDEIEKALAGVQSSGQTDSGVTAGLFGSILTWLSDHTSDVFFVATSNDVAKLPPEFSRSERFDATYFLDSPVAPSRMRSGRSTSPSSALSPGSAVPTTASGRGPRSNRAVVWLRCWTCPSSRRRRTSCRWPRRRARPSNASGRGVGPLPRRRSAGALHTGCSNGDPPRPQRQTATTRTTERP